MLVEVLAAENDLPVRPPTLNPALLPFTELSPPAFERLVAEVVLYVDGLQQVRVYGRSGQAQGGLDIIGGPVSDRSVYQVRRITALTSAALRAAVIDYAGQPGSDTRTRRFGARRFVLATACPADDTNVEDELDRLQREYDGDLTIELYDGAALSWMLRHRGALVAATFSAGWALAYCDYRAPEPTARPSGQALLDDPIDILGYTGVRERAEAYLIDKPLAAAQTYRDLAEMLRRRGMGPAAESIERHRRDALAAGGEYAGAFAVTVESALRSYDADRSQAPVLTEVTGYLEHLGAIEAAVLEVVEAVLGWADDGYDVASVAAALDVVVAAAHETAAVLVVRVTEQVVTDDDPADEVGFLTDVARRALPLATGESRVRLACCLADLALREGTNPQQAFTEPVRQARRFELNDGLAALVLRRAGFAHASRGRNEDAIDLYRAAVVHAVNAGLGGDARDALRALSALSHGPAGAAHNLDAIRAITSRERLLPGSDGAALETLELLVDEKMPGALGHARTWVRHERINGALRDEWVARRRLGQVLHHATEHQRAVEQFVRAGARKDATAAARAASYVDLTRHLVPAGSARVQAAAAAVIGVQGDVLPDEAITEVTAALLAIVEGSLPDVMFGPAPGKYALGAIAALGARLPVPVAQQVLQIVEPLVPRRQGTYRFIDEEIVAALAAVARSSDHDLARRAGAALVEAVEQDVQRAADTVISLGPDVPGLEAAVQTRAEAGDDDAVRVLAAWDQWHPCMAGATRRALEHLFAHPVGQQRSSFGLGVGPQRAALLLRPVLGSVELTDGTATEFTGRVDEIVEHLLRWTEDSLDIAESRRTASDALVLLANRLTDDARPAAFARVLAVHDDPGWNPSDLYTHASLHPLSRFRIDVGSEQLPLACLRTAAALASGDNEVQQVTHRLTATLLRPTDDRHAAPLLERALVALAPVTPLPLEHLAAHPAVAVRRAAAYSWGQQSTPDPTVAEQLVRDPHATVRLQIAHALRSVDNDADLRYRQLLDDLREDVSYAVRHAATPAAIHRSDAVRSPAR